MVTRRAFTLVELAVTILILAVLAALTIPALNTARRVADNSICMTNLRNLGQALLNYTGDNDGYLPGPVYQGLGWSYQYPQSTVTSFLTSYLNGGNPKKGDQVKCPAVLCPAYKRQVQPALWDFAYYAVYRVKDRGGSVVKSDGGGILTPWGHSGTGTNNKPVRLSALQAVIDPAAQWAIRDADKVSYGNNAGLPAQPVHGVYWNQLYFDWHVEALLVADRTSPND